jgi:hypothetical protein
MVSGIKFKAYAGCGCVIFTGVKRDEHLTNRGAYVGRCRGDKRYFRIQDASVRLQEPQEDCKPQHHAARATLSTLCSHRISLSEAKRIRRFWQLLIHSSPISLTYAISAAAQCHAAFAFFSSPGMM